MLSLSSVACQMSSFVAYLFHSGRYQLSRLTTEPVIANFSASLKSHRISVRNCSMVFGPVAFLTHKMLIFVAVSSYFK